MNEIYARGSSEVFIAVISHRGDATTTAYATTRFSGPLNSIRRDASGDTQVVAQRTIRGTPAGSYDEV